MTKRNVFNSDFTYNADGFDITAGTTSRCLSVIGGNVTLSGGGNYSYTFPAADSTLYGTTVTPITATNISATSLSSTNVYATTITSTTTCATNLSAGTGVYATTITATTLSGTTLSGTNVKATTVTATNVTATNITASVVTATSITSVTNLHTTTLCSTTATATTFTGTNVKVTTVTATTLSGTTFSGTNVYATTVTATNLTATNISATTYQNIPTTLKTSINFPADCWVTRSGTAGWAGYTYTQGTNLDYGQLDYDKDTDEQAFTPPFKLSNYTTATNLTANIYWKTTAVTVTQSAVWVLHAMSNVVPIAWDASFTQVASAASLCPSATAGTLQLATMTFSATIIDNNDPVVLKLQRNADDGTYDTMSADASMVLMNLEWA